MALNIAWIALSLVRHLGQKTLQNLLTTFGSPSAILGASIDDLKQVKGVGPKIAGAIHAIDLEALYTALYHWQSAGVQIIPQYHERYPQMLLALPDAPLTLFVRGNYDPPQWENAIAIVGTRRPTAQARKLTGHLAELASGAGCTVVSGLAMGVDHAAHQGALHRPDTTTLAVLGGGVLNVYPSQHTALAERICEQGALLSENAPDAAASAPRLVTRNRIISALSQHVIVVQSDLDGGAMHAARAAIRQGRSLHTIDWPFSGNQWLLEQGANPIDPVNPVIPSAPWR